jgi:hypothetical protein
MRSRWALFLLSFAALAQICHCAESEVLDEYEQPRITPGMVRLASSHGMKHGGYYDKYFTVYEVSTNVFAATPDWTPASLKPIPLPVHEAYAIYMKWREKNAPVQPHYTYDERIELSSEPLPGESYLHGRHRWYYTLTFNMNDRIIILLDGTIVESRVIDLRTEGEKAEYEERLRRR